MTQLTKAAFLTKWATGTGALFKDNTTGAVTEASLRAFVADIKDSFLGIGDTVDLSSKENVGVAAGLVTALLDSVASDGNTLYKLRALITALAASDAGKEVIGVAATLVAGLETSLKGGVATDADTLAKLRALIVALNTTVSGKENTGVAASLVTTLQTNLLGGVATDGNTLAKLRALISTLATSDAAQSTQLTAIQTLLASNDTLLDSLQEIVDYIKSNKSLIDSITTDKLNVSVYNAFLTANTAALTLKADLGSDGKVLSSQLPAIPAAQTSGIPAYNQVNAYLVGEQVSQLSRFWSSKVNIAANTASSAPPTDPAVISNSYWTELSGTHLQNTDTALKTTAGVIVTTDSIKATQDNAVLKTGDQTVGGIKTFSATIIGQSDMVLGHTAASARLHIRGASATTGNALLVENSAGTALLTIGNNGVSSWAGSIADTANAALVGLNINPTIAGQTVGSALTKAVSIAPTFGNIVSAQQGATGLYINPTFGTGYTFTRILELATSGTVRSYFGSDGNFYGVGNLVIQPAGTNNTISLGNASTTLYHYLELGNNSSSSCMIRFNSLAHATFMQNKVMLGVGATADSSAYTIQPSLPLGGNNGKNLIVAGGNGSGVTTYAAHLTLQGGTSNASSSLSNNYAGGVVIQTALQTVPGTLGETARFVDQKLVIGYATQVPSARLHVRGDSASSGLALRVENSAGTALLTLGNAGAHVLTGSLNISTLAGTGSRTVDTNANGDLSATRNIIPFGKYNQYSTTSSALLAETSLLNGSYNGTLIFNNSLNTTNPELYTGAGFLLIGNGSLVTGASVGALQLRLKYGSVSIADSGSVDLSAILAASTTYLFRLEMDKDIRSHGTSGTVFTTGRMIIYHPTTGDIIVSLPLGSGTSTAVDTTVDKALDLSVQQTVAAATVSLLTFKIIPVI